MYRSVNHSNRLDSISFVSGIIFSKHSKSIATSATGKDIQKEA